MERPNENDSWFLVSYQPVENMNDRKPLRSSKLRLKKVFYVHIIPFYVYAVENLM